MGRSIRSRNVGGFVFSVSFGYFVKWFGSYDLALIPVALMLMIGALAWLRVDATEEVIPDKPVELLTAGGLAGAGLKPATNRSPWLSA